MRPIRKTPKPMLAALIIGPVLCVVLTLWFVWTLIPA